MIIFMSNSEYFENKAKNYVFNTKTKVQFKNLSILD